MSHFSLKNISWKMVLNLILIIAILILIAQNLTSVALNIFTWRFDVPLFLLIVGVFVIGFYTAVVLGMDRTRVYTIKTGEQ